MSGGQEELQNSAERIAHFDQLYAAAPLSMMLIGGDGAVLHRNAACDTALALEADEGIGQSLSEVFVPEDDFDPAFAIALAAAERGKSGANVLKGALKTRNAFAHRVDLHLMCFGTGLSGCPIFVAHCLLADTVASSGEVSAERGAPPAAVRRAASKANNSALWSHCPETGDTWFSDDWFTMLGYTPGALPAAFKTVLDLIHPADRMSTARALTGLMTQRTPVATCDFRVRNAAGAWRWIGATGAKTTDVADTGRDYFCGTQTDITVRKEAEIRLEDAARLAVEQRAFLDELAENSPAGLFDCRQMPDNRLVFLYISQSVLDIIGVTRAELEADGRACSRHFLPECTEEINAEMARFRQEPAPFRYRARLNHPEKGLVCIRINSMCTSFEDGSMAWRGSVYDVTPEVDREKQLQEARDQALVMQKQMEKLALHDVLTGLPNRRYFDMRLLEQREKALTAQGTGEVTLIRVDLDHFKCVNDNLGHDAGDAVLVHVAKLLRDGIRPCDFASRIGGDEFSIILGDRGGTQIAHDLVKDIRLALKQQFFYRSQVCRFGASFGIATCDVRTLAPGELHAFADVALYEAKQKGRNRVEVFTRSLHNHIIENRRLTAEIEEALERREFEPVFQPQFCARNRTLVGIETLARWHHPTRGVLAPDVFMDVAEQIRAVPLIDQMMLEKARAVLSRWRTAGFVPPKISFNVSSGRLRDPEVLHAARRILSDGTPVAFELLESVLVEDENDEFRFNLDALKDSGILIEIDDFGSGHASIIGVMEAEPSVLKIDKRLSRNVVENLQARELIEAIVRISRALNISTTVEGVETHEQARILIDLGCDVLQGYLYAKPMDEHKMLAFSGRVRLSSAR